MPPKKNVHPLLIPPTHSCLQNIDVEALGCKQIYNGNREMKYVTQVYTFGLYVNVEQLLVGSERHY